MRRHGYFLISVLTGVSEVAAFEVVYSWAIHVFRIVIYDNRGENLKDFLPDE